MAGPEGYEQLARIGFVDRGNYSANNIYKRADVVYDKGSTWVALKDNLKGITPNEGDDWKYLARGFVEELLSNVTALDNSGMIGEKGEQVNAQSLIDEIADKVATKLLLKTDVVSQIVNDATKAASMAALYSVKQMVDKVNGNLNKKLNKAELDSKTIEVTVESPDKQTEITEMEGEGRGWIPVIVGHGSKIHSMATISFDGYSWYISATVAQLYRIIFYKYPST